MSQMEFKVALRLYDENINNPREHLQWMRETIGEEPTWIEGESPDDDMPFNFSYIRLKEDGTRKQHTTRDHPYFAAVDDGSLYGVDLVLVHTVGELPLAVFDVRDLAERYVSMMANRTGIDAEHVQFVFYGWHNGGDEPIEWH
jgi:hypothetical protein